MVIVYFEIAKDHQKHKQVVDTERELNHVPSDELQHAGAAVPEENEHSKSGGQRDPHARPDESFAKADSMGSAIQHSQIEHQHRHDEEVKKNPEEEHRRIVRQVPGPRSQVPGHRSQVTGKAKPEIQFCVETRRAASFVTHGYKGSPVTCHLRPAFCYFTLPRFPFAHSSHMPIAFISSSMWVSCSVCSICARPRRGPTRSETFARAKLRAAASATCFLS